MRLKSFAIFIVGLCAGMAAPYNFFKKKYREEKEFEIESIRAWKDDEINALKEENRSLRIRLGEDVEPAENEQQNNSDKKEPSEGEDPHLKAFTVKSSIELYPKPNFGGGNFTDYSLYSKQAFEAQEEIAAQNEHPEDDLTEEEKEDLYTSEPREIDFGEFNANRFYSKVYATYYALDDAIIRDEYDSVEDAEFLNEDNAVGNVLTISGFKNNSVDEIYVRNFSESTDYFIKKVVAHYYA